MSNTFVIKHRASTLNGPSWRSEELGDYLERIIQEDFELLYPSYEAVIESERHKLINWVYEPASWESYYFGVEIDDEIIKQFKIAYAKRFIDIYSERRPSQLRTPDSTTQSLTPPPAPLYIVKSPSPVTTPVSSSLTQALTLLQPLVVPVTRNPEPAYQVTQQLELEQPEQTNNDHDFEVVDNSDTRQEKPLIEQPKIKANAPSNKKLLNVIFWSVVAIVVVGVALTGIGALVEIPLITPIALGLMKSLSVSTGVGIGLAVMTGLGSLYGAITYGFSHLKQKFENQMAWNDANAAAIAWIPPAKPSHQPQADAQNIIPSDTTLEQDKQSLTAAMQNAEQTVGVINVANDLLMKKHGRSVLRQFSRDWIAQHRANPVVTAALNEMQPIKDNYGLLANKLQAFAKKNGFHLSQAIIQEWPYVKSDSVQKTCIIHGPNAQAQLQRTEKRARQNALDLFDIDHNVQTSKLVDMPLPTR